MRKIRIVPSSNDIPADFYSWGEASETALITRNTQVEEQLQDAFDSIEIKEDEETPELDYTLRVMGKEAGRIVIPFAMVVKNAYYDTDTKEIVLVIQIGQEEEREVRVCVEDLVDVYEAGEGLKLTDNIFTVDFTKTASVGYVNVSISKVEEDYASADSKIKEEVDKKAEIGHTHEIGEVSNLQETLDTKLNRDEVTTIFKEQIYNLFNIDVVSPADFNDADMNNPKDNYSVVGLGNVIKMEEAKAIVGKSVQLKNVIFETAAAQTGAISLKSPEVSIVDTKLTGEWDKSVAGNAMVSINNNREVNIENVTVARRDGYNAIEIGLDGVGTTESVVIDGLKLNSSMTNNAINIFSLRDNAEIIIQNCHFVQVSNPIRISNATYAKHVNITIKDCKFDKWESSSANYAGMILFQDYTSKSKGEIEYKKPFSTFTITIDNVTGPYGKISKDTPMEELCGSGIVDKQIVYMYGDYYKTEVEGGAKKPGLIPYTSEMFPTIIVK